jgi:hypothetical protein
LLRNTDISNLVVDASGGDWDASRRQVAAHLQTAKVNG